MPTRIILWKASSAKSFGHIAMELSDGTYVSWWPESEVKTFFEGVSGKGAKWYDDLGTELTENGDPTKTLYLTNLNEENIKAYFKRLLEGSKKWDLKTRSCSTVIYNALCEGADWFKGRAGDTTTPQAVAELVEAFKNGQKDKKIKLGSFCK